MTALAARSQVKGAQWNSGKRSFASISALAAAMSLIIATLLTAAQPVAAEPVFSFATTPGTLPKSVVPVHNDLDLAPDLDKLAFIGVATIDIDVTEPTDRPRVSDTAGTREPGGVKGRGRGGSGAGRPQGLSQQANAGSVNARSRNDMAENLTGTASPARMRPPFSFTAFASA
jgi:hypothetical protein